MGAERVVGGLNVKCDDAPIIDGGFFLQIDDDVIVDMDVMEDLDIPCESQKALGDNALVATCVDGGGGLADKLWNDCTVEHAIGIQKTVVWADMRRGATVGPDFQYGIDHGHWRLVWQERCGWYGDAIHKTLS